MRMPRFRPDHGWSNASVWLVEFEKTTFDSDLPELTALERHPKACSSLIFRVSGAQDRWPDRHPAFICSAPNTMLRGSFAGAA
jgi:hypothetical protein